MSRGTPLGLKAPTILEATEFAAGATSRLGWPVPFGLLLLIILLLGAYAESLNAQFYQSYIPFFDSAAYNSAISDVVAFTRHQGVSTAVGYALDQTAPLPFLEAILLTKLGLVGPPLTRSLGIRLQLVWLVVLASTAFLYWYVFRRRNPWVAAVLVLPLAMFETVFHYNGGLQDFRLDLSLYLFVGIALTLYLMTNEKDHWAIWLAAGVAAGLGSLSRATAPVYLTVMLGPVLIWRVWKSASRSRLLRRIA